MGFESKVDYLPKLISIHSVVLQAQSEKSMTFKEAG